MKITLHNQTKNPIKGYNDMLYDSGPVKFSDNVSNKYNIVHRQLYEDALKGYLMWYIKNVILNSENGFLFYLYKAIENTKPYQNNEGDATTYDEEHIYDYISDEARDDEYKEILRFLKSISSSVNEAKEILQNMVSHVSDSLYNIENEMINVLKEPGYPSTDPNEYSKYNYEHKIYGVQQTDEDWNERITNFFFYTHDTIYLMEEYSPTNTPKDVYADHPATIWEFGKEYVDAAYKDGEDLIHVDVNTLRFIVSEKGDVTSEDNDRFKHDHDIIADSTDTESSGTDKDSDDIPDLNEYCILLERFSTDDISIFYDNSGNFIFKIKNNVIIKDPDAPCDDDIAADETNEVLYNIIQELFERIIKTYNNDLLNNLANIIYKKMLKYHNCIEIKNTEYWLPSMVILTSKKYPYTKYGPIDLTPWWNSELVEKWASNKSYDKVIGIEDAKQSINSAHHDSTDDFSDKSINNPSAIDNMYKSFTLSDNENYGETIQNAEVVNINYVRGKATLRSKISEIEYEVDFDDLNENVQISDEMIFKPKFLVDYDNTY